MVGVGWLVGWLGGSDANKDKANASESNTPSTRLRADPSGPVIGVRVFDCDRLIVSPASSSSHFIQTKPRVLTASVVPFIYLLAYNPASAASPMPSRMRRCFTARCHWNIHVIMAQGSFFQKEKKKTNHRDATSHIETRGSKPHCFFLQLHSFGAR
jgi:hypothetical protein